MCRTWSLLLSRPRDDGCYHGPLRVRGTHETWGKEDLSPGHADKCHSDNLLLLRMVLLIHVASRFPIQYLLEHPADPGEPHPSWWITDQCASLIALVGGRLLVFDACRLGQIVAKATAILTMYVSIMASSPGP